MKCGCFNCTSLIYVAVPGHGSFCKACFQGNLDGKRNALKQSEDAVGKLRIEIRDFETAERKWLSSIEETMLSAGTGELIHILEEAHRRIASEAPDIALKELIGTIIAERREAQAKLGGYPDEYGGSDY